MRDASARRWASRWRVRWGGACGRLTIRNQIPLFLMQEKVYLFEPVCASRGAISFTPPPPAPWFAEGARKAPHRASGPPRLWTAWRSEIRTAMRSESLAAGARGVGNVVWI